MKWLYTARLALSMPPEALRTVPLKHPEIPF